MSKLPIVILDTETTGLDPEKDDIIQIAAIATSGWPEFDKLDTMELKIEPSVAALARLKANKDVMKITVYNEADFANAKEASKGYAQFKDWMATYQRTGAVSKAGRPYPTTLFMAYNAHFDADMLMGNMKRHGLFFGGRLPAIDVLQLAMPIFLEQGKMPPNMRLDTLCKLFDIELVNAHDAMADVTATWQLAQKLAACLRG